MITRRLAGLGLVAALAACGGGGSSRGDTSGIPAAIDPASLCVDSSCGSKTAIIDIPSAENILFTPEGRLFVSGDNVYEITRDASGGWHATGLREGGCTFTGLALRGDVLYANCFDGQLYAGRISDTPVKLEAIHDLGLLAPNGLAAGPDGSLYLANGPLASNGLPDPKIVRLRFGDDPFKVIEQTDWLPLTVGASFPNGVRWANGRLYFSDSAVLPVQLGAIRYVTPNADGSAGPVTTLGTFPGLPDDFNVVIDHVLMASYSNGQIALMSPTGRILAQTLPLSFDNPSSVALGQPPLFAPTDILVTEKGLLGVPPTPGYGNRLSVFTAR